MALKLRQLDRLLDALRPKDEVSSTEPLGVSGTPAYAGWLVSNETSQKLVGREKYKTFSEMVANLSIVAAGVRYFLNLTAKPNWKVEEADKKGGTDAQRKRAVEIVEAALSGTETPWRRVVRRAAMYKFYGFAIAEWTAKNAQDGMVILQDVEPRPQITIERWDIDEGGMVAGVLQRAPRDQRVIYLPREKLVYAVDDALVDSPEGLGLFRHIAEPARRLERYLELEGFGFEGDLRGMPIVKAPIGVLNGLKQAGKIKSVDEVLLPFRNFLQNHIKNPQLGFILDSQPYTTQDAVVSPSGPPQWEIDFGKQTSTGAAEVAAAIERINTEIARIIGVEHLIMGGNSRGASGSFAMSRDKSDRFATEIDATLAGLAETFEKDICRPLMLLNGLPIEVAPHLKTDPTAYRDVEQITTALLQMAQAGAVLAPNDPVVKEVRDMMGLTFDQDVIEAQIENDAAGAVPMPRVPGKVPPGGPGAKPAPGQPPATPAAAAKVTPAAKGPPSAADTIGKRKPIRPAKGRLNFDAEPSPGESAKMEGDQTEDGEDGDLLTQMGDRQRSAESDDSPGARQPGKMKP